MTKIKNKQTYYAAMAEIETYLAKGFSALTTMEEDRLEELYCTLKFSLSLCVWNVNGIMERHITPKNK